MECAAGGEGVAGGGVLVVATIAVAARTCIAAMAPVSRREEVVAFSVAAAREVGEAGAWEEEVGAEAVAVVIRAAVAREVLMRKMVLGGKVRG